MLTRIMNKREDREAGFTLIELLVVVIIIGILAAIAIPVFLNQRNSARNASVESDLRNIATVMETYYTQNDAYPAAGDLTAGTDYTLSPNNGVVIGPATSGAAGAYSLTGCNAEALVQYTYESDAGGLQATTTDVATCATGLS